MPRHSTPVMRPYRQVRSASYNLARAMGNWGPLVELLLGGDPAACVRKLVKRQVRRAAGKAFSRLSQGAGGGGLVVDMLLMLAGRAVGGRGR